MISLLLLGFYCVCFLIDLQNNFTFRNLNNDRGIYSLDHLAFLTFYGNYILCINCNGYTGRNANGHFTNSRHK